MAAGAGLGARDRDLGGAGEPDAAHQEEVDGNRHGCRDFPVLGPPPRAAPEAHQQEHGASMRGSLEHSFTPSEAAAAVASARRAAWSDCAFDRKLTFIGFVLHSVTQVVSLLSWHSLPLSEKSQRVGSVVFAASMWVLPTAAPTFYLQWRKELLILYRIGFFAFPLLRKPRGIQHVLDATAQPGARGVVKDLYRVIWGSRLMAVLMAAMLNPLPLVPLAPQLVLQAYAVAMIRSNNTLCATPLLSAPLSAQRIHRFHSLLHALSHVLPGGVGQSMFPLLKRSGRQQEAECESFLTFLFCTVGLLLPVWLLVKTEPLTEPLVSPVSPLGRLEAGAETVLRLLCGRSWLAPVEPEEGPEWLPAAPGASLGAGRGGRRRTRRTRLQGWERGFAWWLLLALLWAVCVAVHSNRAVPR